MFRITDRIAEMLIYRRRYYGKLAVLDISETGRQICEKLFVLLNTEQREDLTRYVLSREQPSAAFRTDSVSMHGFSALQADSISPLTEIQEGDLYFCLEERMVRVCWQEIALTVKEFDALHLLIINRKRVLTFEMIAYQVWGRKYIDVTQRAIHNLFSRLRQRLHVTPNLPGYVVSVRGVGYKFDAGI